MSAGEAKALNEDAHAKRHSLRNLKILAGNLIQTVKLKMIYRILS